MLYFGLMSWYEVILMLEVMCVLVLQMVCEWDCNYCVFDDLFQVELIVGYEDCLVYGSVNCSIEYFYLVEEGQVLVDVWCDELIMW